MVPPRDVKRRLIFGLADRILVNAPEIRDTLAEVPWIDARKIALVVNGTDLEAWHPRWTDRGRSLREAFRSAHGIPPDVPLAVNVGNLTGQKDQGTLVAACARLRKRVPGLRVLICGEGPERSRLEAAIAAAGLGEVVVLAGFTPDVAPVLAAADLFVLSSVNEGMAWVLMEAAASGLATVTTDVSGARYAVADGETGLVVPPGAPDALGDAMAALLQDPARREAMGRRARVRAETLFSERRMLDETAAVLFGPAPRP
jgi:glycosyltransferase involved in cell wall biosynthesis